MAWLPDREKISKISLFVLAQLTNVSDRQTDRRTPGDGNSRAMHSIARQKSDEFSLRYGDISIFKMAAVRHRGIVLPPYETTHEVSVAGRSWF